MMDALAKATIEAHNDRETVKQPLIPLFQDIGKFVIPRRKFNQDLTKGDVKMEEVGDTTAVEECENLAAVIQSMILNLYSVWLSYTVDEIDSPSKAELEWCDITSRVITRMVQFTNLAQAADEAIIDLCGFGTGILFCKPGLNYPGGFNFTAVPIEYACIEENELGLVDVLSRRHPYSPYQYFRTFGVKPKWVTKDNDTCWVIHETKPRMGGEANTIDPKQAPFASVYVDEKDGTILNYSGYYRFPYFVPRWRKSAGALYGSGPGATALPVARLTSAMAFLLNDHLELGLFSPLDVEKGAYDNGLNLSRLALNERNRGRDMAKPLIVTQDAHMGLQDLQLNQEAIRRKFFMDKLFLVQNDRMTIEEVRVRISDNMKVLGPTFGRWDFELLTPLADMLIQETYKMGKLPQPPASLVGSGRLKVKFVSPLAQSMRNYEISKVERCMMGLAGLAQYKADIIDNFDIDSVATEYWRDCGLPEKRIRKAEEVGAIRQQRQQQMAMEMMANAMTGKKVAAGGR